MRRDVREVDLPGNRVRYLVTVRDDDGGPEQVPQRRAMFLQLLADNPRLLECGPAPYETVTVRVDGTTWVAEAEATVTKERAW